MARKMVAVSGIAVRCQSLTPFNEKQCGFLTELANYVV